jgi:hypothetical protein
VNLALPAVGRHVLGFGFRTLRRLGLRPTAINSHVSLSSASVKRYTTRRHGEEPSATIGRRMRREHEEALVLYWCAVIAGWRPLAPVAQGRRLLDAFCPVCLHALGPAEKTLAPGMDRVPGSLEEALALGGACCTAGVRPCVQGPARLAALVSRLGVHPESAATFLTRMEPAGRDNHLEPLIHPLRLWVRTCLSCGEPIVTDAAGDETRHCRRHARRSA